MIHMPFLESTEINAADPAHGACRRGVCINQACDDAYVADLVDGSGQMENNAWHKCHFTTVRAVIHVTDEFAPEQVSLFVQSGAHFYNGIFTTGTGQYIFGAIINYFYRPSPAEFRQDRGVGFKTRIKFSAESPSYGMPDNANLRRTHIKILCDSVPDIKRILMARMDGIAAVPVNPNGALGFNISLVLAIAGKFIFHDEIGVFKCNIDSIIIRHQFGCDIAMARVIFATDRLIGLPFRMHEGRIFRERGLHVAYCLRLCQIQYYCSDSLPCLFRRISGNSGDGFAFKAYLLPGKQGLLTQHPPRARIRRVLCRYNAPHPG